MGGEVIAALVAISLAGVAGFWAFSQWVLGLRDELRREISEVKEKYVRREDDILARTANGLEVAALRVRAHELSTHVTTLIAQVTSLLTQGEKRDEAEQRHHEENRDTLQGMSDLLRRVEQQVIISQQTIQIEKPGARR